MDSFFEPESDINFFWAYFIAQFKISLIRAYFQLYLRDSKLQYGWHPEK